LWEFGFSSAAEAARIGMDLLDPNRGVDTNFERHRSPGHASFRGNGAPPDPENPWHERGSTAATATPAAASAEPETVDAEPIDAEIVEPETVEPEQAEPEEAEPETVEPDEVGPDAAQPEEGPPAGQTADPGPAAAADVPPAVPDELVPDHVDEDPVLVAETAEEGAEDGAGPELTVEPPWDGYDRMTAADIRDRLSAASAAEAAAVELYESTHKSRRSVLDAAARALRS
jgi:hypothetical protein